MTCIHSAHFSSRGSSVGLPLANGVQVGGVQGEPPPELASVPDVAVAGHHLADAGHGRQPLHPGAVVAERIGRERCPAAVSPRRSTCLRPPARHCPAGTRRRARARARRARWQPGRRPVPRDDRGVQRPVAGRSATDHDQELIFSTLFTMPSLSVSAMVPPAAAAAATRAPRVPGRTGRDPSAGAWTTRLRAAAPSRRARPPARPGRPRSPPDR